MDKIIAELRAASYEVFKLEITQLQRFEISNVFRHLPNLSHLTLTYGAKHIGMAYERPLFGMKMSDAQNFKDCLRSTTSLVFLSLPGNLIDDDLVSILIKGLMLNKTITQLDLSHNKISQSGARKISKYLLQSQILTHLNLGDNNINYEGSRYLCQAFKVNTSLISLNLKLNRIDDKAGQKMCIDLHVKNSHLEELNLAANYLANTFCESLAEYISYNQSIKKLDISSNKIEESNANTLKGALLQNERII
jgi:Ran GTPase-activating protein (RanGAP) involved in mRNA processing and transport